MRKLGFPRAPTEKRLGGLGTVPRFRHPAYPVPPPIGRMTAWPQSQLCFKCLYRRHNNEVSNPKSPIFRPNRPSDLRDRP